MRKYLMLTLAAILTVFSGPLLAADLPLRRAPPQRQTYQPPPSQDEALPPPQTYQAPPQRFAAQPQCPYAGGPSPTSPCAGAQYGGPPMASPCAIAASPCGYGGGPYLAGAYAYPPPFFGGFPGFGRGFLFGRGFGFGHHFGFGGRI